MLWVLAGVAFAVGYCAWALYGGGYRSLHRNDPMLEPGDPRLIPAVKRLIADGDVPTAIAMYRDATGKSLEESTAAVEAIVRGEYTAEASVPPKRG